MYSRAFLSYSFDDFSMMITTVVVLRACNVNLKEGWRVIVESEGKFFEWKH